MWTNSPTVEPVEYMTCSCAPTYLPAKSLHNSDRVSVDFNHFYCMGICEKLSRHLSMLTYIYLNMDEC